MTANKVKIGIVGIGNMGVVHVEHVSSLPNTELVAICDTNQSRIEATNADDKVARFSHFEQMLDSAALDAVIIATPHYDHPDMCIAAFKRGIHVLVEKPIAVHVKESQRMIDAYRSCQADDAKSGLFRHVHAARLGPLAGDQRHDRCRRAG